MATVLCTWELGSGLGHWSTLLLPIEAALRMGHRVLVAARHLSHATEVLRDLPVTYLQAPFKQDVQPADHSAFQCFGHLIRRQSFSDSAELAMYLRAWRALFDLAKPDLVLFKHSPTALIASRSYRFKKVVIGNGFSIPPQHFSDSTPFAPFVTTPRTPEVMHALRADDAALLGVINTALTQLGSAGFSSLAEVYAQADERIFLTWPELDHFGTRPGVHYLGSPRPQRRDAPVWPPGGGAKVFAYVSMVPAMEQLLRDLAEARVCTLMYVRDLPQPLKDRYASDQMRFVGQPVDLSEVAARAAWVINHANHASAAAFMVAGVPQLLIPRHQEQLFLALRLRSQGCALMAFQDQPGFATEISAMGTNPLLRQHAQRLQQQCAARLAQDPALAIHQRLAALLQ